LIRSVAGLRGKEVSEREPVTRVHDSDRFLNIRVKIGLDMGRD
jgi:hypothetical protein